MSVTKDNMPARRCAQLVGLVGIGVGVVCLAAMYTTAPINPLIAIASFVPLLLVATCVGLIVSLIFRRWVLLAGCVVILAVATAVVAPLYVANGDTTDGPSLKVMQANLLFGEADPAALVDSARDQAVDVLTVQELTVALSGALEEHGLEQLLPYQYLIPDVSGGGGAGIYSRYPLSDAYELGGFGPTNLVATVGFTTPFTLVAVHPGPAYVTPPEIWTTELGNLQRELVGIAATGAPVVVSGDFNTTYLHKQFREILAAGYTDAADQLGAGIVPTYPANKDYPAIVGIDHVLLRNASALSLTRLEIDGSDHYGLVVDVAIESK
ncbi:endonuclease/exonuclease/phosphatase family protein [Rhodococcus sp. G-MC3]|uniref:endonuclease/exonuclease/phosphatase family protein n=1 Tax=Rhodococcus sp. G-MC3 TaxID=3046209 RepID=UPI0024B8DF92|nr:endonuclease/exonuclease/phosphatase family protein [Rhodococcus sp. G-MC3]MDJ0396555.1 endonuclease/exonuclease/phosphatase family protein [Rhodococcus sp. G-MC3]